MIRTDDWIKGVNFLPKHEPAARDFKDVRRGLADAEIARLQLGNRPRKGVVRRFIRIKAQYPIIAACVKGESPLIAEIIERADDQPRPELGGNFRRAIRAAGIHNHQIVKRVAHWRKRPRKIAFAIFR